MRFEATNLGFIVNATKVKNKENRNLNASTRGNFFHYPLYHSTKKLC